MPALLPSLKPAERLVASALLNRIAAQGAPCFSAGDARALWRRLPPPGPGAVRLRGLRAGAWEMRRFRLWLHWVVEAERPGGPRLRLRYTLLGDPVDLLRHGGRRLAFRPWPGIAVSLDLGPWRPWKLPATEAEAG
ncbi:hypothetical protein [Crenalkalicoccus roseus]|uniref:hypothetical protein n=1 Tax=Crenalkalicoccus roseus TaxID=1485588 RepID=UPI00107FD51F|nr:hypothetical protein [Crenalkalicoccus roseus]